MRRVFTVTPFAWAQMSPAERMDLHRLAAKIWYQKAEPWIDKLDDMQVLSLLFSGEPLVVVANPETPEKDETPPGTEVG